mgnify:FL=1
MLKKIEEKFLNFIKRTPKNEQVSFDSKSIYYGHQKVKYKGVIAQRCPFDYVIIQMIVSEVKPDLIIEIGTNEGGGALYLSDLLLINDIKTNYEELNRNIQINILLRKINTYLNDLKIYG